MDEELKEFCRDLFYMIDQGEIDRYYGEKKKEVAAWVVEYTGSLKRIKEDQRKRLLTYAEHMTFLEAGELNAYAQSLTTISKKDKERLRKYLRKIDWLPKGQNMGVLEGMMVSRVLKDPYAEAMLEAAFGKGGEPEGDE